MKPLKNPLRRRSGGCFLLSWELFRLLGVDRASAVGGFIGRNIFYSHRHHNGRARSNLRAAYPDMSDAKCEAIIVEMWDNLGRTSPNTPISTR